MPRRRPRSPPEPLQTLTDHDGRYAATGLPEDLLTLVLLARESKPVAVRILPRSGHTVRRDFTLQPRDTA
jgi:hypothetical protein